MHPTSRSCASWRPGRTEGVVRGLVAWDTYHDDMAEMLAPMLSSAGYREYRTAFDDWLSQPSTSLTFEPVTDEPHRCLVMIPRVMRPHAEKGRGDLDPAEAGDVAHRRCLPSGPPYHPPNRPVPQCD